MTINRFRIAATALIGFNVLGTILTWVAHLQQPDVGAGMDWDAVDARLDAEAQRRRLRAALGALSEADRELLLLVAWEGVSPTEAAAVLGITKVAAWSRLHRARHRALQALSASGPGGRPTFMTTLPREEAS